MKDEEGCNGPKSMSNFVEKRCAIPNQVTSFASVTVLEFEKNDMFIIR